MTPMRTRSAWCAKRRTPCQNEQPGATDISAKMMKDLHHLETQAERPCPEPDYDQNEDAGAASTLDTGLNARAASSADQQQSQERQDDIDQMKETMSTFEAEVKNTFRDVANNQEECEQDFKKIRVQIKISTETCAG